jgi:hypothetical protein
VLGEGVVAGVGGRGGRTFGFALWVILRFFVERKVKIRAI